MKEFVEKVPYMAPNVKVVSFQVERGFQTSQLEVSPTTQTTQDVDELIRLGIITEAQRGQYNGAPTNNAGYFMGSGSESGYFGNGWN